MSLRIGLCVHRTVEPELLASLWPLARAGAVLAIHKGADVAYARNEIVRSLVEDRLLFVDGDMVFQAADVQKLFDTFEDNPELGAVSALYVKWDGSRLPVCNWRNGSGWLSDEDRRQRAVEHAREGGVVPVDSFGGGMLLTSREALDKVGFPWFEAHYDEAGDYSGNDTSFCTRLKQEGYTPSVDFSVPVGHVGPTLWHAAGLKEA